MEEKKSPEVPVWTEEQWEKWIYTFAIEINNEETETLALWGELPKA